MDVDEGDTNDGLGKDTGLLYRLCPRCGRAVPGCSKERYCVNDGERLLEHCPVCQSRITNPYARHCAACGRSLRPGTIERTL